MSHYMRTYTLCWVSFKRDFKCVKLFIASAIKALGDKAAYHLFCDDRDGDRA